MKGPIVATLAPTPKPSICSEKQRLANALVEAVQDVMKLHQHEIAQLLRDEMGAEGFDIALRAARKKRRRIKMLYQLHLQVHGC